MRQVIRHWEKAYRANTSTRGGQTINDPVLAIDVEDQDQNPLKAGLYFEPTDCQACKCAVSCLYFDLTKLMSKGERKKNQRIYPFLSLGAITEG